MAESITIHFNEPDPARVLARVEARFGASIHQRWCFPADDYLILGTVTEDWYSDYEKSDRDDILSRLQGVPTLSIDFEIRRSRSDEACDLLERFVRVDLQGLTFVVNEGARLISSHALGGISDFLECYRYKRSGEQDGGK